MNNKSNIVEKVNNVGINVFTWIGKVFYIVTLGFLFDRILPENKSWSLRKTAFITCLMYLFIKFTIPWVLKLTTGLDVSN